MPQTSERIRGFTESVIRRMTRIANQFGAINLSQGFPDFDPPHRYRNCAALPGMFERTIYCSSLSQAYSITGWRLGYVIAPPVIIDGVRKVYDFLTVGAAAPLQAAAGERLLQLRQRWAEDHA